MLRTARGERGSLWEVLAILALLLAALTAYAIRGFLRNEPRPEAMKKACAMQLKRIEAAADTFLVERGEVPAPFDAAVLLRDGYLKEEPICMANGRFSIAVEPLARGGLSALATCSVHGHIGDWTSGL